MKTNLYLSDTGLCVQLTPETLKDAATLAYLNRNLTTEARRVTALFADAPSYKGEEGLTMCINLNTKRENKRTAKL